MIRLLSIFACLLLQTGLFTPKAQADDYAIVHAGSLLIRADQPPLVRQSLIIRNGLIINHVPGFVPSDFLSLQDGDTLILHDLSEKFVLPGLIDAHVHLTFEFDAGFRLRTVELSEADRAIRGAGFARSTLLAGFTTVRDQGGFGGDTIFALRDGIENGDVIGPRIHASGDAISTTGGHGDPRLGFRDDIGHVLITSGICDGVSSCRSAVREQVRRGADHIKLMATAGVLSTANAGLEQQFFDDELIAIVNSAHAMGRKIVAHAHGAEGIKSALAAGVDTIEHGTFLDEEAIKLFKENDAYLSPTLMPSLVFESDKQNENSYLNSAQREKASVAYAQARSFVRQAHEAGVNLAFGTDAGTFPHGQNAREFNLLVEWGGLSPAEAIFTATLAGARNLGLSHVLGSLEVGKFADLIAVDESPLKDITQLEKVKFVMKSGIAYGH